MPPIDGRTLLIRFAEALPLDSRFAIHHLSSPPTSCPAIYSAPPGQKQEKTFCERHFLSVTIGSNGHQLQVFALEVLIYTTEHLSTLFISKADSTGYIHILRLPKGTPSPLKTISSTFLAYLVETRQRADRRLVVSLFARAQDQYLFPGSIENPGKHVLDDRGLVRWWCQVLDPVLQAYPLDFGTSIQASHGVKKHEIITSRGYLRVPGCDDNETKGFFPEYTLTKNLGCEQPQRWNAADPLRRIGRSPAWPERCLIARFPDDPKARFVDELDDELLEPVPRTHESPSKGKYPGRWKSVRSLEHFWEMMAFRQECSSGRLVGFIWAVFTPTERYRFDGRTEDMGISPLPSSAHNTRKESPTPSPSIPAHRRKYMGSEQSTNLSNVTSNKTGELTGRVEAREPRTVKQQPAKTRHYYWPTSSRGQVVLRERDYQRIINLMLHLDYANKDIAEESTRRWIGDVSTMAGRSWGQVVVGRKLLMVIDNQSGAETNGITMTSGLIRKKKKRGNEDGEGGVAQAGPPTNQTGINVLPTGLVRKKVKTSADNFTAPGDQTTGNGASFLDSGLIRKKPRPV